MAGEDAFQELVAEMVTAGWGEMEALDAIEELARNHRRAIRGDDA